MKALILNSGIGKRMGELTKSKNKCMAEIAQGITILDWQIQKLEQAGITDIVITTGPFAEHLQEYVTTKYSNVQFTFRHNSEYNQTNYIYSIALAEDVLQEEDIILMHGDLIYEESVLKDILTSETSAMVIDKTLPLPEKDFKAVVKQGKICKVGIEFFKDSYAAQPLYQLKKADWKIWLTHILKFCQEGKRSVYAENAMNEVSEQMNLRPLDINGRICMEVDNLEDLSKAQEIMKSMIA